MATILVDYENVCMSDGLKGVEYLTKNDTLIIFYSQCCEKIRAEYIDSIERSQCDFKIYKLVRSGKNALDFYIATECGSLCQKGETQIVIISKDKGFSAIPDFLHVNDNLDKCMVVIASNIENGLTLLNDPEDVERRRIIKEKTRQLNITSEQARLQANKEFVYKVHKAFEGTEYENSIDRILEFLKERKDTSPKVLYIGSMQRFGRDDGRAIYRRIKEMG